MLMPDVNILVYAHRRDEATHASYAAWLKDVVDGPEPFALSVLVAVGFVRIVTNPGIYHEPTPLPVALAAVEQLTAHPRCRIAVPAPNHFQDVARLCRATDATGKLVSDAQHAALDCTGVHVGDSGPRFRQVRAARAAVAAADARSSERGSG